MQEEPIMSCNYMPRIGVTETETYKGIAPAAIRVLANSIHINIYGVKTENCEWC